MQYVGEINHFSYRKQGTVFGDKIKDARNCGYAQMEELRCVFFFCVLSSKYVSHREQQEHHGHNIQQNNLVESKANRSHAENYRNEEISRSKAPVVI